MQIPHSVRDEKAFEIEGLSGWILLQKWNQQKQAEKGSRRLYTARRT
jgi:hypothetical protein